jgi:hypothetical protein
MPPRIALWGFSFWGSTIHYISVLVSSSTTLSVTRKKYVLVKLL